MFSSVFMWNLCKYNCWLVIEVIIKHTLIVLRFIVIKIIIIIIVIVIRPG